MKKLLPIFLIFLILNVVNVSAHCPLCTAAVGTGVAVTRFYGVDDSIVGVWIGAFVVSTALWFNKLLKKAYVPLQSLLLIVLALLLTIIPLYFTGIITNIEMVKLMPEHHSIFGLGVLGIDKLFVGILIGTIITLSGFFVSDQIKKTRNRVLFPYQSIVLTTLLLILMSFMLWFIVV